MRKNNVKRRISTPNYFSLKQPGFVEPGGQTFGAGGSLPQACTAQVNAPPALMSENSRSV
jgi:hypothetical protein